MHLLHLGGVSPETAEAALHDQTTVDRAQDPFTGPINPEKCADPRKHLSVKFLYCPEKRRHSGIHGVARNWYKYWCVPTEQGYSVHDSTRRRVHEAQERFFPD